MYFRKAAFASLLISGSLFAQEPTPNIVDSSVVSGGTEAPIDVENAYLPATESIENAPAEGTLPVANVEPAPENVPAVLSEVKPGTILKGNVNGFLTAEKSPYWVDETLVLPEGRALIINAGVVLEFAENAGIDVRGGSIAVMGESENPVVFKPKTGASSWKGIAIAGNKRSEFQNVQIIGAEYGVDVESGVAELSSSKIENSSGAAVYVKNGTAILHKSYVGNNSGAGVWALKQSSVTIDESNLEGNHIAVVAGDESNVILQMSSVQNNEYAIVSEGDNLIVANSTEIEENEIGFSSKVLPSEDVKNSLKRNKTDIDKIKLKAALSSLKRKSDNAYAQEFARMNTQDERDSSWKVNGSVLLTMGGHEVLTNRNIEEKFYVSGSDTIPLGKKYKNYFQVPGFFANWNAYLQMESPYGQSVEFSMDASHDAWNKFNVHSVQASYKDKYQNLMLGDVHLTGGETYMAGFDMLGASYDLGMFHNMAGEPLFEFSVFGGEVNKPLVEGDRDPDMYNDYIEDGEAEVQKLAVGGKIRWNMHRRFNGTLGVIGSKDFWQDPIMRDGPSEIAKLANPIYSSKTFFADGNWLFFPGDIELNGQIALGGADTSNVQAQRAMNKVFADAGLNVSNYAQLRRIMKNPLLVNNLKESELEKIFGYNSMMTVSEMRKKLLSVLETAKQEMRNAGDDVEEEKDNSWSGQNLAVAASYHWSNGNTSIEGHFRFVGNRFFSIGSPDLLQNSRLLGGSFETKIRDFWVFNFGYELNVENASGPGDAYNIFGLAEGAKCGLIPGADDDWLKEHEQDANRTLYNHDGSITNKWSLGDVEIMFRYAFNYRTRSTNQRLYANYSVESGIFDDSWFAKRSGHKSIRIISEGDTVNVDSARWAKYYDLANEKYLATQFNERLLKNTLELGLTFKMPSNVLKIGGVWTFRTDLSKFEQDDLLDKFDFSDKTYGILGYYFHGGDYFEQRYPISLTTTAENKVRNVLSVVPRYKIYNRDDMTEFEWNVMENVTFTLVPDFAELSMNANFRQYFLDRTENGVNEDEMEIDFDGSMALRFQHTKNFSTEWLFGSIVNCRPDNRSEGYTDVYGSFSAKVDF